MSTRPTAARPRRTRTLPLPVHGRVAADPGGLWTVPGHGKRARYAQHNCVVSEGAFPTPFG